MRKWTRRSLWALGALTAPVVALLIVNAVDEPLTPEAKALMEMPKPPEPSERNSYVHLMGIGGPDGEAPFGVGLKVMETLRQQDQPGFHYSLDWDKAINASAPKLDRSVANACGLSSKSCLESITAKPELRKAVAKHANLMARYDEIRAMPEHAEVYYPKSWLSFTPSAHAGIHQLSIATAAMHVQAANLEAAIRELEHENAFVRKVAADASLLGTKYAALNALQIQALFISDLVRTRPAGTVKYQARLQALVRPLSAEESDLTKVLRTDTAFTAASLERDAVARFARMDGSNMAWLVPLFYRQGETINLYARQNALRRKVLEVPAQQYAAAADAASKASTALVPAGGLRNVINPVGQVRLEEIAEYDVLPHAGRVHDAQGILALASTQLALVGAGAKTAEAIERALAGPIGAARPDPFTGKPMVYDPKSNSLGFESRTAKPTVPVEQIKKRFGGRIAVVL